MDTSKILRIALELNELNESIENLKAIVERNKYEEYPYIEEELGTIFSKVLNERLKRRESLKKDMMNENLWRNWKRSIYA